jgi:uncharacterized membrane protein
MTRLQKRQRWPQGSFLLGFGLLGSVDGIMFHQLLQWHSVYMHTDRHGQIVSDGLFHAGTVVALVWGALLLWRSGSSLRDRGWLVLFSGILIGGGSFNLTEGLINHHLLQIHHVKPGDPNEFIYDMAYLLSGIVLIGAGYFLRYRSRKSSFYSG